jgi:DNA-binding GntR family transcriptional regulator
MSRADGTPSRRLRLVRTRRPAAHTPPRVDALDAFLREVDDLRLTLETDLSLAASAVESGATQLASDILSSDRASVGEFQERALGHLGSLDVAEVAQSRRVRVPIHAGPILVAAALVGVLAGAAPRVLTPPGATGTPQTVAATDSLQRLQELAASGDTEQVRQASLQLHRQLAGVVANAKADPLAAQTALMLLTFEQSAIVRSGDSKELADVLRQSQALVRAIVAALPPAARTAVPHVVAPAAPERNASSPKPQTTTSPARSTSSPKPAPTSSPKPAPSPTASPTKPADPYPLPSAPFAGR